MHTAPALRETYAPLDLHGRWLTWCLLQMPSNAQVRRSLTGLALPCPHVRNLQRGRSLVRTVFGDVSAVAPSEAASSLPFRRWRLDRLATGAAETLRAQDIVRMPRVRELVEGALLLHVPPEAIAAATWDLLGVSITAAAVTSFEQLFFRMDLLTRAQLRVAIDERVRCGVDAVTLGRQKADQMIDAAVAADSRIIATTLLPSVTNWGPVLAAAGYGVAQGRVDAWVVPRGQPSARRR